MKRRYGFAHKRWRLQVIARDKKCVVCGKEGKYMNAHHLVPSNFSEYEFLVDNGLTLCAGCHTLSRFSAHKNPIWFCKWLAKHKPELYWLAIDRLNKETNYEI